MLNSSMLSKISTQKILFMGSPEFACPSLTNLIQQYPKNIIAVCSQSDKIRGRNKAIQETPVKKLAKAHHIPVYTPQTKTELTSIITKLNPTLIIVIAYGFILEKKITDSFLCINAHASLLPKYRGASPMQSALLNNDNISGITLIQMDEGCDTGPILAQTVCDILPHDHIDDLHDKLAKLSATTLINYLKNKNNPLPRLQRPDEASHSKKIQKTDLHLDLNTSPEQLFNKIRAYSPFPGAFFIHNNKRFKILRAGMEKQKLIIEQVKPEGKAAMPWKEACLGYPSLKTIF